MVGNINSLPAWARDKIIGLERQVSSLKEELSEIGQEEGDVYWTTFTPGDKTVKHSIPRCATVYLCGAKGTMCFHLDMDGKVSASADRGRLIIRPSATNAIYLESDR